MKLEILYPHQRQIVSSLTFHTPVPFQIITTMWSDRYDELTELWKKTKRRFEENTTETLNSEQQYQRDPYRSILHSQYGLNRPTL